MLQSTASTINYLLLMGVAHTRNKLALRTRLLNLSLKTQFFKATETKSKFLSLIVSEILTIF